MPIYEPGLEALVADNVRQGRLSFGTDLRDAGGQGERGLHRRRHAFAPGRRLRRPLVRLRGRPRDRLGHGRVYGGVVTKSTVPVGTGDEVERIIREAAPQAEFAVVSNPEFLREGAAIGDFKRPDRIVVGTEDPRAEAVMREVYRPLYLNASPILVTGRRTAELTKYAANAFLAAKITFINEMADLCEAVGADVQQVARGIGLDGRIGTKFLHAGPGYGGSCFPKDTLALAKTAQDYGMPLRIVETVVSVNDQRKRAMARKVIRACGGSVRGKTVALLGLNFKPDTDDMPKRPRSPSRPGFRTAARGCGLTIRREWNRRVRCCLGVTFTDDAYSCAEGADAVVIVTEWNAFRALDLDRLRATTRTPILVDLRNIYDPATAAQHGFAYQGVGRGVGIVSEAAD